MTSPKSDFSFLLLLSLFFLYSSGVKAQVCIDDPTFSIKEISSKAGGTQSLVTVDLNCDGHLDILTGDFDNETLFWWQNDGDEDFTKKAIKNHNGFAVIRFTF